VINPCNLDEVDTERIVGVLDKIFVKVKKEKL